MPGAGISVKRIRFYEPQLLRMLYLAGEKGTASGFVPGTMYSLDSFWAAMFTAAFPETTLDTPDIYTYKR
jgi:hypothetical protein